MNDNQLRDMTREWLQNLSGVLPEDSEGGKGIITEQPEGDAPSGYYIAPAPDAAQAALSSFQELLELLSAAEEKAAEMYELIQIPGSGDAMAGVFGGPEAGEIVDHLERVFDAAGYSADGTTLKSFL
jgi:hypothetical protein